MHHLLLKLREVFPTLNVREFTEVDCWAFVKKHKIAVKRAPLEVEGYTGIRFVRGKKRYYMMIDERLDGVHFLKAFLHEIGHVVLHDPRGSLEVLYLKRDHAPESKQEAEADIFMLLAILPKKRFLELSRMQPDELHPFPVELLLRRRKLFEQIGE